MTTCLVLYCNCCSVTFALFVTIHKSSLCHIPAVCYSIETFPRNSLKHIIESQHSPMKMANAPCSKEGVESLRGKHMVSIDFIPLQGSIMKLGRKYALIPFWTSTPMANFARSAPLIRVPFGATNSGLIRCSCPAAGSLELAALDGCLLVFFGL